LNEATRRYLREFVPAIVVYALVVLFARPLVDHAPGTTARVLFALAPMVPTIFVVRAIVRRILAGDELERRICLQAMAISNLGVGLVSFTLAFLASAGVFKLDGADALVWVFPSLLGSYGIARYWAGRRYR
jgi:hypothetical protein